MCDEVVLCVVCLGELEWCGNVSRCVWVGCVFRLRVSLSPPVARPREGRTSSIPQRADVRCEPIGRNLGWRSCKQSSVCAVSELRNHVKIHSYAQLLVYKSKSKKLKQSINIDCNGIFHMVARRSLKQIWVVCDIDKTIIVVDTDAKMPIKTIPQPAVITADGPFKPHDVTVGVDFAVVTFLQPGVNVGYLAKFSAVDFSLQVVKRVGGDPHLYTNLFAPSDFVCSLLFRCG